MAGAIAALALLGLFHPRDSTDHWDAQVRHAHVAGWRIELQRDRFTERTSCTIKRAHVAYGDGVLTFEFGHGVDTANAVYRLGNGPVLRADDVAVEAAGRGARFDTQNLDNPSNGEVHLPLTAVGGAQKVSIRANTRMAHRVFDLTGFSRALNLAKQRNCDVS